MVSIITDKLCIKLIRLSHFVQIDTASHSNNVNAGLYVVHVDTLQSDNSY